MVARHRSSGLHAYALTVSAVGFALLAILGSGGGLAAVLRLPPVFWALVVCLVVNESIPVLLPRAESQLATTAETFAFAILLGWGTTAATFALVLGVLVADLLRRAGPEKVVFNIGQYVLVMVAAGGVYEVLGGGHPFTATQLPAFAVAAGVFFIGNLVLVGVVTALAYERNFLSDLRDCMRVEALPS